MSPEKTRRSKRAVVSPTLSVNTTDRLLEIFDQNVLPSDFVLGLQKADPSMSISKQRTETLLLSFVRNDRGETR